MTATRISILYTMPNFVTAGSGGALANIVRRLPRDRFDVRIAVLKPGGRLFDELPGEGIPVDVCLFKDRARPYAGLPLRIRRAARRLRSLGRFDIVHSWHYGDDYTEPLIARAAGAKAWVYTKKNMNWNGRAWKIRSLLATRIVAQNRDMEERFFAGRIYRRRVVRIPRGVDTRRFAPDPSARAAVRDRFGIPPESFAVACVAQMVPVKGHDVLIEALSHLPESVIVLFAGGPLESDYGSSLKRRAEGANAAGRIRFLGYVRDVPDLLRAVDAAVLPTLEEGRMEGCPVALLEAMSCGLPCIATDIPGSRDIVADGENGRLIPPGEPDALAAALRELLDDPEEARRIGGAARRRVLDRFSIEREVDDHVRLYEEIAAGGR